MQQICFLNGETDIPSCQLIQKTAVTDIVLILHNVSLCQRAWVISIQGLVIKDLLNQAHAGHRPVRAWFLRIASVHECLYACVCFS